MPTNERIKRVHIFNCNGQKIYPKTVIDAITDGETGEKLSVKMKAMVDDIILNSNAISELRNMIENGGGGTGGSGGSIDVDAINKSIADLDKKVDESIATFDQKLKTTTTILNTRVDNVAGKVTEHINNVEERVDDVTNELHDARIGYDGTSYNTAGEAIREQVRNLKSNITTEIGNAIEDIADEKFETTIDTKLDTVVDDKISATLDEKIDAAVTESLDPIGEDRIADLFSF